MTITLVGTPNADVITAPDLAPVRKYLIYGLGGNDYLTGGSRSYLGDDLFGGDGNDTLYGLDGNDKLWGGNDRDSLFGGNGRDQLRGEDGNDFLSGGDGNDILEGGNGWDVIDGGAGNDILRGGLDPDELQGGSGDDRLYGGAALDILSGGIGNDYMDGGADNDQIIDLVDNNTFIGGSGNDTLIAGNGEDVLFGGDSIGGTAMGEVDMLTGGGSRDRFILADQAQVYYDDGDPFSSGRQDYARIHDFNVGEDVIQLKGDPSQYFLRTPLVIGTTFTEIYYRDTTSNEPEPPEPPIFEVHQSLGTISQPKTNISISPGPTFKVSELIGIVENVSAGSLDLNNSSQFVYV